MDGLEHTLDAINDVEQLERQIDDIQRLRVPRLYIRDDRVQNPLTMYTNEEFKCRYRFSKQSFMVVFEKIAPRLHRVTNRGLPVPPHLQLLIALRFYCTGSFQTVCGDLNMLSQPTVSLIVAKVSKYLALLMPTHVRFPEGEAMQRTKEQFERLGRNHRTGRNGIPCIVGAIDCTHIKITRPRGLNHSEVYRNRKGYFSLNVQAIVGPDMEFYDLVVRWPGGAHDSRIFRNSRVYTRLQTGDIQGILVGDGGYPSSTFMLTPLQNPTTPAETRYNYAQIHTRNVVERTFGVWKKIFPCLQLGLRNKLTTSCNIIVACAVLHNIRLSLREEIPLEIPVENVEPYIVRSNSDEGLAFRQSVINNLFS